MDVQFPRLTRRYFAALIDGFVTITLLIAAGVALQGEGPGMQPLRVAFWVVILFGYEPIFTSKLCTLGQRLIGIRVRRNENMGLKIGIFAAYIRFAVKILLGLVSFFIIGMNENSRAIHDFAAGSVMIDFGESA